MSNSPDPVKLYDPVAEIINYFQSREREQLATIARLMAELNSIRLDATMLEKAPVEVDHG